MSDPNKEHLEPVVNGGAKVHKKSKGKAAVESFLGDEVESIKDHIVYDMVIPSTKDALNNMFGGVIDFFNDMMHDFIDSILFGGSESKHTKASQTFVSYQGYYNRKNRSRTSQPRNGTKTLKRHTIDEIEYISDENETGLEKATKVYNEMIFRINNYKEVSVSEFFDLSGVTLDWTEEQEKDAWGWTDVNQIGRPRRRRGNYIIPLPRPARLED